MKQILKLLPLTILFFSLSSTADIAVVVNVNNPYTAASSADLKNMYRARVSEFSEGNPIVLSYQPANLDITHLFFDTVVGKSMTQLHRFWASRIFSGRMRKPIKLDNDTAVIQWIANNKNGIGYIDETNLTDDVKKVATIETPRTLKQDTPDQVQP